MVLYPRSGFGGKIFVLRLIRFNQESIDSRLLHISLSMALWEVIPFIYLLQDLSEVIELHLTTPKMKCKIFEDNESCIVMAK